MEVVLFKMEKLSLSNSDCMTSSKRTHAAWLMDVFCGYCLSEKNILCMCSLVLL